MEQENDSTSDMDQEIIIGSPIDHSNNNPTVVGVNGHQVGKQGFPCLLKDDSVVAMNWKTDDIWSGLVGQRNRKNCEFITGTVIVDKNWQEMKICMQISWENGNAELLNGRPDDVAYGDRVCVLDRRSISQGSRVFLLECPEVQGVVVSKKYVVTGRSTKYPDLIFEDIDSARLQRETHGSVFKDTKILFHGWLGITSGFRTRVYLQSQSEDNCHFSIIVDGNISQNFNIGDVITLGFKMLRGAEFVGDDTGNSNWLVNFFRFYNTNAVVIDCEIEQLLVCWIGKASSPNTPSNQSDLADAPDDCIPHEELCNVHYLLGNSHHHMTTKSLWSFQCLEDDVPVSQDKWSRKWQKLVDWDRWEYPTTDELSLDSKCYLHKYLTLEIMYIRSVVEVLWNNGSIGTLSSKDVLPEHVGSVWSNMIRFHVGSIVTDCVGADDKDTYGIIVSLNSEFSATVKWITPTGSELACDRPKISVAVASLHNLAEKPDYEYISKYDQCPLVRCGEEQQVGVVLGISTENQMVLVNVMNQVEKQFWPHQLTHYKCDILLCPKQNRWVLWYEHLTPPSGMTRARVGPDPHARSIDVSNISRNLAFGNGTTKKKIESIEKVPLDNIFVHEEMLLRSRETSFCYALERELSEMENFLPDGMWLEHYQDRVDIFSIVISGPKDSLFEDFIFIFDIFLLEDFPRSEPHINFRSFGVTLIPDHLCQSGAVFLPEDTRVTEENFTHSYTLNLLLELKDFLGLPLEVIHEKNAARKMGIKKEGPEELYKFATLAVLDYTLAMLHNPPRNWCSVIRTHFIEAFPRIAERFKHGNIQMKRAIASISNEIGDFAKPDEFEVVTVPWSESYMKSVSLRVSHLQKIYDSLLD